MTPTNSKVVIITGGSSGIGAATARRLARDHMRLTLAARRKDRLKQVAAEVESLGGEVLIVPTDVRKNDDIQHMVQATLDRWGRIDVLFNNAGLRHCNRLLNAYSDDIRDEIHVNLIALIECAQAVLPVMLHQKSGHIINVASIAGLIGRPGSSIYSATKFGVNGFTDALHRELLNSGIHVSAVCPGYTPTEFSANVKAVLEGRPDAPKLPGMMPITYVADQVARLIQHPRLRVIIPHSWKALVILAFLFPGLADVLVTSFIPKKK